MHAGEDDRLGFELVLRAAVEVEHAIDVNELPIGQQLAETARGIDVAFAQILCNAAKGGGSERDFKLPAVRCFHA